MRIGYADDLHFCGKTTWLAKRWPMIVAALAEAGLEAQPTKSEFWSPSADLKDSHQLPHHPSVDELEKVLPRVKGGIDLLGGAAASHHECSNYVTTNDTAIDMILHHTSKRVVKAAHYVRRLRQFLARQISPFVTHTKVGSLCPSQQRKPSRTMRPWCPAGTLRPLRRTLLMRSQN